MTTPAQVTPVVGQEYEVRHSRKGTFCMKVTKVEGEWISGTVISGVAKAMMSYNVAKVGESVTIRDSQSYFIPINLSSPIHP